ncbi:MAG: aconitase family protein, partial [bacterium]
AGKKINQAILGTCTNGSLSDMEDAIRILGNRHIASGRTMKITPATRRVYSEMLDRGYIEKFFRAGALIQSPGCGGCASGQVGMTGEKEVQVSTSNRNFKGKQGKGDTYLVSPAVAAAAVLTGELTDPREVMP